MALTLGNFVGFETDGLEEATGTLGSPTIQGATVRTGSFALELDAATERFEIKAFEGGVSDAGDRQIAGVAFNQSVDSPAQEIFRASDGTNLLWRLTAAFGTLRLKDTDDNLVVEVSAVLAENTWHYIEVLWQHLDSGQIIVHVDGVEKINESAVDMSRGTTFSEYWLRSGGVLFGSHFYDDFYCMSGAASVSDFLGKDTEVLGTYQNTAEDATDQGDTLDAGTWANVGETPTTVAEAEYTASPATGFTRCDEGARSGPASDITNIIKGGKWLHQLMRDGGPGTTHYKRYGLYDGSSDSINDVVVSLTTSFQDFFTISESMTYVPDASTEYCAQGFRTAGAQDILCKEIWAFLLHIPAVSDPPIWNYRQTRRNVLLRM